jgi:DNA-binding CsgD family transcriptional regulator
VEALALAAAGGRGYDPVQTALVRAELALARDDIGTAREVLAESALDAVSEDVLGWEVRMRRARVALAGRDAAAALAEARAVRHAMEAAGSRTIAWGAWRLVAARAHRALGDEDAARSLSREHVERARSFGAPAALGEALLLEGELADDPVPVLEEAVDVLEGSMRRVVLARALVALGAALRRANRRADAREPLTAGRELAHECGATALAERARDELLAAGARPRRIVRSGVDALTASERRVAELAAGGATNREIAQALFVTIKTVEDHLGAAYRKLDVRGRRELAAKLPGRPPMRT